MRQPQPVFGLSPSRQRRPTRNPTSSRTRPDRAAGPLKTDRSTAMTLLPSSLIFGLALALRFCGFHVVARVGAQGLSGEQLRRVRPWSHIELNVTKHSQWQDEIDAMDDQEILNRHFNSSEHLRRQLMTCNVKSGQWVFSKKRRPWYAGTSCPYIRSGFNCMRNGRKDRRYFHYRWSPWGCNLPQFKPKRFMRSLRNKVVAFIGDSISRNMEQSVICQLAATSPAQLWTGWLGSQQVSGVYFPQYNTKIMTLLAPFLTKYSNEPWAFQMYGLKPPPRQRIINGNGGINAYVVWLDQPDPQWANVLNYLDLAVFLGSHWFLDGVGSTRVRSTVFVRNNVVQKGMRGLKAYSVALQTIKAHVQSSRTGYKGVPMWLTYTPSHYTVGNPPTCRRLAPLSLESVQSFAQRDISTTFHALETSYFGTRSSRFRLIDITMMSTFRADGHVKTYYGPQKNSKTKWDCLHWCLPGVPDVWGDVMQHVLYTQVFRPRSSTVTLAADTANAASADVDVQSGAVSAAENSTVAVP